MRPINSGFAHKWNVLLMSNKWIWHSDDRYAESEEMWAVPGVLRYLIFNLRFKMTKFTAVFCVPSSPFPHACRFLPARSAQGSLPPPYQWTGSQRLLVGREERAPAAYGRTRGGCRCGMVNVETGLFPRLCGCLFKNLSPACHWWRSRFSENGFTPSLFLCK